MKNCRCCAQRDLTNLFTAELIGRNVSYYECKNCRYVQTEEPTWLKDAYASAINASDTGIMVRNLSNVSIVLATLTLMGSRKKQIVDYAGGYGFLVRLLRDIGVDALWADPYSDNLVARGFEFQGFGQPALVSAFEAFEHFVNPIEEMKKLLSISGNILLTTTLVPEPTPQPKDWWYYGLDHGQHIGFYRVRTLQYLADRFGLNLLTDGVSTHFISEKKYSHIAWRASRQIAKRMPKLFAIGLNSKTWTDHLKIQNTILSD